MSEIEAIEFRIAELHQTVQGGIALLQYLAALIMLVAGLVSTEYSILYFALSVTLCISGTIEGLKAVGRNTCGYIRVIGKTLGETYEDPPFDEWYESLEDKNAFPVDGDD